MSAHFGVSLREEPAGTFNVIVEASVGCWELYDHQKAIAGEEYNHGERIDFAHEDIVYSSTDESKAQGVYEDLREKLR